MKVLQVSGRSMRPFLRPGDRIHVRRVDPRDIRIGDVVVYSHRTPDGILTKVHRVLLRQETPRGLVFWAKGDAESQADPPVPAYSVRGVVFARDRNGAFDFLDRGPANALRRLLACMSAARLAAGTLQRCLRRCLRWIRIAAISPDYWPCRIMAKLAPPETAAPRWWRVAPDRFRPIELCALYERGEVTRLEGRLDRDAALSGEICLSGDAEVPEWATLTIRPGSVLRAEPGGPQLSFRRDGHGQILELCQPGRCHLVVRGRLVVAGDEARPVSLQAGTGFGGLVLIGAGRARIDWASFEGNFLRSAAAMDSSAAEIRHARFSGGEAAVLAGGRARVTLDDCSFEAQEQSALLLGDGARASIRRARFLGGRSAVSAGGRAEIRLDGCSFEAQESAALNVADHSRLGVRCGSFRRVPVGLRCCGRARTELSDCGVSDCGTGAALFDSALLAAARWTCRVEGSALALHGASRARIRDCRISSRKGAAVFVDDRAGFDDRAGVLLRGHVGLRLRGRARARLLGTAFAGFKEGLIVSDDAAVRQIFTRYRACAVATWILDRGRGTWIAGAASRCGGPILRLSGGQADLVGVAGPSRGAEAVRVEGGQARLWACSLAAADAAVSVEGQDSSVSLRGAALRSPVAIRLRGAARASGAFLDLGGSSVGYSAEDAPAAPRLRAVLRPARRLSGALLDRNPPGVASLRPRTRRDRILACVPFLERRPLGRRLLALPYSIAFRCLRRIAAADGRLWVRRSWARGEARPGFSDLDLLQELKPLHDDPVRESARLRRLGRLWRTFRSSLPFIGEPILAESEDIRAYLRFGGIRSRLEVPDWKSPNELTASSKTGDRAASPTEPVGAGGAFDGPESDRAEPASIPIAELRKGIDRWTIGLQNYIRLAETAADPAVSAAAELWRYRAGHCWTQIWRHARDPLQPREPPRRDCPSLPEDRPEACAAALAWAHAGAVAILGAVRGRQPGALSPWTLRPAACLPILEEAPCALGGIVAALEDPGHLTYLLLSGVADRRNWRRAFESAPYLRARHEFLRCAGVPVTAEVLSLALCGPYQDWPYQARLAQNWPKYRPPAAREEAVLWRWASEEGAPRCGLERDLLLECYANLRLHWRGRLLDIVGAADSCGFFFDRLPSLGACLNGGDLPAPRAAAAGACACRADWDGQVRRVLGWIRDAERAAEGDPRNKTETEALG